MEKMNSHKIKYDSHKYDKKKGEFIQLKTDLPNVPIDKKYIILKVQV